MGWSFSRRSFLEGAALAGGMLAARAATAGPLAKVRHEAAPDAGGKMTGDDTVFLSNLDDDPGEMTNLRHKHPELVDELSTSLHRWFDGINH